MTHKAIYTCNPPYLANLVQWHTPSRNLRSASASLLSVTRCNISFGARGYRSAAPAIWNSLPSNVRSCETLTTFRRHLKSHLFHSVFAAAKSCIYHIRALKHIRDSLDSSMTHLSASDSFTIMALYKFTYLLTYLRSRHSLTQNISEMAKDTAIVTIEGE